MVKILKVREINYLWNKNDYSQIFRCGFIVDTFNVKNNNLYLINY